MSGRWSGRRGLKSRVKGLSGPIFLGLGDISIAKQKFALAARGIVWAIRSRVSATFRSVMISISSGRKRAHRNAVATECLKKGPQQIGWCCLKKGPQQIGWCSQ